jgi:hypothetical protein
MVMSLTPPSGARTLHQAYWVGGGAAAGGGGALCPSPKLGRNCRQAATRSGDTAGSGLSALGGCCDPRMIGSTQSLQSPKPSLASPFTKPAPWQAATICSQGGGGGAACAIRGRTSPTTRLRNVTDETGNWRIGGLRILWRLPLSGQFTHSATSRQIPRELAKSWAVHHLHVLYRTDPLAGCTHAVQT